MDEAEGRERRAETVACAPLGFVELSPGALTPSDMARACGLWKSFFSHKCSICEVQDRFVDCFVELDRGTHGLVTRVVCAVCLPAHFEKHLKEQAGLDALVEAVPHEETVRTECPRSQEMLKESITLTIREIKDLAEFAGLVLDKENLPDLDDMESEVTVSTCPGIQDDDGKVSHHRFMAHHTEYPEEGFYGLGEGVAA